jgi:hypothetical protein
VAVVTGAEAALAVPLGGVRRPGPVDFLTRSRAEEERRAGLAAGRPGVALDRLRRAGVSGVTEGERIDEDLRGSEPADAWVGVAGEDPCAALHFSQRATSTLDGTCISGGSLAPQESQYRICTWRSSLNTRNIHTLSGSNLDATLIGRTVQWISCGLRPARIEIVESGNATVLQDGTRHMSAHVRSAKLMVKK